MSNDRKGLTVLSLLLILIVLSLITVLVIRSMGSDEPEVPLAQPRFALQLLRGPEGELPAGASDTVTVRATDGAGAGLAGFSVNFVVTSGNGSVAPASAVTDANGNATVVWTIGTDPLTNELTAELDGNDVPPLVISVDVPASATP